MNYNEKIKEISLKTTRQYLELMKSMKDILNKENYKQTQAGVSVPISKEEANMLHQQVSAIRENINAFNYYTAFYPNKEKTWSEDIEFIAHISNILDKLAIDENIRGNL